MRLAATLIIATALFAAPADALQGAPQAAISGYAFVEQAVAVRAGPSQTARPLGTLGTQTFWGTSQIVAEASPTAATGSGGWVQVRAPGLSGWVPASSLSALHTVNTLLKVDRERLVATLYRDGLIVFRAPVAVGQSRWPTPAGRFYVEERITPPDASGAYGPLAFGTSARSSVLTEWPNGGQIGIHGTDEPHLIPGRASHGCIRLRNSDILRLGRLMPVGTPVVID